MAVIRLTLEYDGTGFSGWAAQPGLRTEEWLFSQTLLEPSAVDRMEAFLALGGQTREVELDLPAVYDRLP